MLRGFMRTLLKIVFRVEVRDYENNTSVKEKALLIVNSGSLLDPLLVSAFSPQPMAIAVDKNLARKWWIKPFLCCAEVIEVDFLSPTATLHVVRAIEKHTRCMVLHRSRFTTDPHFMKILEATALIMEKAQAVLLPVRIHGAAYSYFSYFRNRQRLSLFPKIRLTCLPAQKISYEEGDSSAKERRQHTAIRLYSITANLLLSSADRSKNIVESFTDAVSVHGRKFIIAEDHSRTTITYGTMLLKMHVLGRALGRVFKGEERVGFMLPSSLAGAVCFLGLHVVKKIPAMINFTAGVTPVVSACKTVQLKSVVTSKKFVQLGELENLIQALEENGIRIVYLEDVASSIKKTEKIRGVIASLWKYIPKVSADNPIAILFTSGTEGLPKAVFMSHNNALSNRDQILASINIDSGDRLFNCLPMFHTFGLGVGTLLPLTCGIRVFFYPSPLHYRIVPQLFYESLSTIICGTDTFFSGYARYGRPYDFCNARLVIAGAEKLRPATAKLWKEKYGVNILEGYGTTETSPVISVNTDANKREHSVGRVFPGMEYRLRPVEGVEKGGVLLVKGPNVMLGYMKADKPGILEPPRDESYIGDEEGWYDTGDIVEVDRDDFIFIKGRAKRFAKVGGEMISLAAVETVLKDFLPDSLLGVVAVPDDKKGEQLVLIIENSNVTTSQIATHLASLKYSALWNPKRIISMKEVPILGSGKFDYTTAKNIALEHANKVKK